LNTQALTLEECRNWLDRHQDKFWWLHSAWSLALGCLVMWLGSVDFTYLRVILFNVAFIWASSLLVPALAAPPRFPAAWRERLRLLVNYFNRNFYQQILFFVLPIYAGSMTLGSANLLFVLLLGLTAVLSTLDIVYDRFLSVRSCYISVFFSFNLFACINVALPVLFRIGNTAASYLSALLAWLGFVTFCLRLSAAGRRQKTALLILSALLLAGLVEFGRPVIPPAPLKLARCEFGRTLARGRLAVAQPLSALPPEFRGRLYVLTAVTAPLGLEESIAHDWRADGVSLRRSPFYTVRGGRRDGYRLWTYHTFRNASPQGEVRVDVVTRGGQLIGRAVLPVAAPR